MHNKSKRERENFERLLLKEYFGGKQLLKKQAWGASQAEDLFFGQKSNTRAISSKRERGKLLFERHPSEVDFLGSCRGQVGEKAKALFGQKATVDPQLETSFSHKAEAHGGGKKHNFAFQKAPPQWELLGEFRPFISKAEGIKVSYLQKA